MLTIQIPQTVNVTNSDITTYIHNKVAKKINALYVKDYQGYYMSDDDQLIGYSKWGNGYMVSEPIDKNNASAYEYAIKLLSADTTIRDLLNEKH